MSILEQDASSLLLRVLTYLIMMKYGYNCEEASKYVTQGESVSLSQEEGNNSNHVYRLKLRVFM